MKAVILAGGYGTRLKKIVFDRPKSMAPIAGIPFLEHQLRLLKRQGVEDIVLCVGYMADKIKSYFGDGKSIGTNIIYSEEEAPLGTAGAIKEAEKYIQDTFLVVNGDSYSKINIKDFLDFHHVKKSKFTLSLTKSQQAGHYGSVSLDKESAITAFVEKQEKGESFINSGVYLFEPDIFKYIPQRQNISIEKTIFPLLAEQRKLYGYLYEGYFIDIGRPETYEQFKKDVLDGLLVSKESPLHEGLRRIDANGIDILLVTDKKKRFLGTLTEKDIHQALISTGNLEEKIEMFMRKNSPIANLSTPLEQRLQILNSGVSNLPILDDSGVLQDVEFRPEEIVSKNFPIIRGRAPLRISFAGGGTDIHYFFEKYGGAVVNATINKYCYATLVKRADRKIIIDSDIVPIAGTVIDSIDTLTYNGKFDLIKAVIMKMKPDFGLELYLYNDIPPGRGLGSSATVAGLVASLLTNAMGTNYGEYKLAEIAYKAEREELNIKGGWQDQYASLTGGFNYMEFTSDKTLVYPLRLKEDFLHELHAHLMLCYVGKSHESTQVHTNQENAFKEQNKTFVNTLNSMKQIAVEIRDALLTNHLEIFGKLLHDSWEYKKKLTPFISNSRINDLYEIGQQHGAYGGKLLGAGDGGYLLFFYQPKRRNELKSSLDLAGGATLEFDFDFQGTKIWSVKDKF